MMILNEWTAATLKVLNESGDDEAAFNVPSTCTVSAGTFFRHQTSAMKVLGGLIEASIFADNAVFVAGKVTRGDTDLPSGFDPRQPLSPAPGPFQQRLGSVVPQLIEMIIIRLADNFTSYLMEIIEDCIKSQPALLKSNKDQMTTELIMQFSNIDDLHSAIIDRKMMSSAYLSLEKQLDWMTEHLGIMNLKQEGAFPSLVELIEVRNCLVHGRARIGAKYVRAVAPYGLEVRVGEAINPSVEHVFLAARAAAELVTLIDKALMPKFSLKNNSMIAQELGQELS